MFDRREERVSDLYFGVQRSQRYHDRRTTHYYRLHIATRLCAVFLAGIVFFEALGAESPWAFKLLAVVGAFLAACDVVIDFAKKAELHRLLRRRFGELEAAMDSGEIQYESALARRKLIEIDELSKYHALDALAHNELCIAMGYKVTDVPCHIKRLRWYHRVTAQWFHWPNIAAGID